LKKTGGFNGYLGIFICACSRINRQSRKSGYRGASGFAERNSPRKSGYCSASGFAERNSPKKSGYWRKAPARIKKGSLRPLFIQTFLYRVINLLVKRSRRRRTSRESVDVLNSMEWVLFRGILVLTDEHHRLLIPWHGLHTSSHHRMSRHSQGNLALARFGLP
jgi:hypothetical protein